MLTVEEVADLLRVTKQTVWGYIKGGEIPHTKVGRRYLIPESALEGRLQPIAGPPLGGEAQS